MDTAVTPRVEYGVEWLNANITDWWTLVNLDTLDLESPTVCVLGQVLAARADETGIANGYLYSQTFFTEHGGLLTWHDDGWEHWCQWVHDAGFAVKSADEYGLLQLEWRHAISEVRALVYA